MNSDTFTKNFPSRDTYLSRKKLLKFWHFVSPRALIPGSDLVTCFSRSNKQFHILVLGVNYSK